MTRIIAALLSLLMLSVGNGTHFRHAATAPNNQANVSAALYAALRAYQEGEGSAAAVTNEIDEETYVAVSNFMADLDEDVVEDEDTDTDLVDDEDEDEDVDGDEDENETFDEDEDVDEDEDEVKTPTPVPTPSSTPTTPAPNTPTPTPSGTPSEILSPTPNPTPTSTSEAPPAGPIILAPLGPILSLGAVTPQLEKSGVTLYGTGDDETTGNTVTYDVGTAATFGVTAPTDSGSPYDGEDDPAPVITVLAPSANTYTDSTTSPATVYTFAGWELDGAQVETPNTANNPASEAGDTTTYAGDQFSMPDNPVTLTAQWVVAGTVTYNANGGSNAPTDSNTYIPGAIVKVGAKPTAAGTFWFAGYQLPDGAVVVTPGDGITNRAGTQVVSEPGDTLAYPGDTFSMPAGNAVLTAEWSSNVFLINDVSFLGDATQGNDACATSSGTCTLTAALQELNSKARQPGEITIKVDEDWLAGTGKYTSQPAGVNLVTLFDGTQVNNIVVPLSTSTDGSRMVTSAIYTAPAAATNGTATGDTGAYFLIQQPVTIDLGYHLSFVGQAATGATGTSSPIFYTQPTANTGFPNCPAASTPAGTYCVTLQGLKDIYTIESSIYIGPWSNNVLITNGETRVANHNATTAQNPERYLLVRGSAQNITLSNHVLQGIAGTTSANSTWVAFDALTSASNQVVNLTIDHNQFLSDGSTACTTTTAGPASGCSASVVASAAMATTDYLNGMTVSNNYISNLNMAADGNAHLAYLEMVTMTGNINITNNYLNGFNHRGSYGIIDLSSTNTTTTVGTSSTPGNLLIQNNTFLNVTNGGGTQGFTGWGSVIVNLPNAGNGTLCTAANSSCVFANNYSQYTGTAGTVSNWFAIGWYSNGGNVPNASHLAIRDNHWDWQNNAQGVFQWTTAGAIDFERNTLGPKTNSWAVTAQEENQAGTAGAMLMDYNGAAYGFNTWFPTAGTDYNYTTDAKYVAPVASSCTVPLQIAPPSDNHDSRDIATYYPTGNNSKPVYVDVYWTANQPSSTTGTTTGVAAEVYLGRFPAYGGTTTANGTNNSAWQTVNVTLPLPGDPRLTRTYRPSVGGGLAPLANTVGAAGADAALWLTPGTTGWAGFNAASTQTAIDWTANNTNSGTPISTPFAGPVATNGTVSGALRVQTVAEITKATIGAGTWNSSSQQGGTNFTEAPSNFVSSPYSRIATISGTCAPVLSIAPAATYYDAANPSAKPITQNTSKTSIRYLHYTLTSSMPIDTDTANGDQPLTKADFSVTATATNGTIVGTSSAGPDAQTGAALNPQIISVTPQITGYVTDSSGNLVLDSQGNPQPIYSPTNYDVVVSVDDTAIVTVNWCTDASSATSTTAGVNGATVTSATSACAQPAVVTSAGIANTLPVTSPTGPGAASITYINPMQVSTPGFPVVEAQKLHPQFYTVALKPRAPVPSAAITANTSVYYPDIITDDGPEPYDKTTMPVVTFNPDEHGNGQATAQTVIPLLASSDTGFGISAPPVGVIASAGSVPDDTIVQVVNTVTSADANYNGLVIPTVNIGLFGTDPRLQLTIAAYLVPEPPGAPGVTMDPTNLTVAEVLSWQCNGGGAGSCQIASGTKQTVKAPVCFLATEKNTSPDDWATVLNNLAVSVTPGENATADPNLVAAPSGANVPVCDARTQTCLPGTIYQTPGLQLGRTEALRGNPDPTYKQPVGDTTGATQPNQGLAAVTYLWCTNLEPNTDVNPIGGGN